MTTATASRRIRLSVVLPGGPADPIDLPAGPASLLDILPSAYALSNATSASAVAAANAEGKTITCKAGCSACCRQLVAVSYVEAVAVADLVAAMPPQRQVEVRQRFADTTRRLERAGLLDPNEPQGQRSFLVPKDADSNAVYDLARRYFELGIPCPLLENESCSIYPNWPTVCREYHVTTPAENCKNVFEAPIDRVQPPVRMSPVLMAFGHSAAELPFGQVPLALALEWAATVAPSVRQVRDGEALSRAFVAEVNLQAERIARSEDPCPIPETPIPALPPALATATIELMIRSQKVTVQATVPTGLASARQILPFARTLTEAAVRVAENDTAKAGAPVSCKKGCGACCRQPVPITQTEARVLADLVAVLPEPRRATVTARFADAVRRLDDAGLLAQLRERSDWADGERQKLGREYFELGVPCPFLDDESCSIHLERPLVCREFLVTSPAENCRTPFVGGVKRLELPMASAFRTFARAASQLPADAPVPWVPLVLALEWSAANPEPPPSRSGTDFLRDTFAMMTGSGRPKSEAEHVG